MRELLKVTMVGGPGLPRIAALLVLLAVEPALANKFETIGSGVSGSIGIKREWLQLLFWAAAGLLALGAVLAVFLPHGNPLFLNYRNWKASASVLAVLAVAMLTVGLLI